MKTLYHIVGHYSDADVVEACSLDRGAADALRQDLNDEVQGELYTVEEIPLVDRYGFPIEPRDFPEVFPTLFAEACRDPFLDVESRDFATVPSL
jgi:hypothetical protein